MQHRGHLSTLCLCVCVCLRVESHIISPGLFGLSGFLAPPKNMLYLDTKRV